MGVAAYVKRGAQSPFVCHLSLSKRAGAARVAMTTRAAAVAASAATAVAAAAVAAAADAIWRDAAKKNPYNLGLHLDVSEGWGVESYRVIYCFKSHFNWFINICSFLGVFGT